MRLSSIGAFFNLWEIREGGSIPEKMQNNIFLWRNENEKIRRLL